MQLKTRLNLLFLILILTACGPVHFSKQNDLSSTSPDPQPSPTAQTYEVNTTQIVSPPNNKLDILLIVDDSNSMLSDNQKLAAKLSNFVSSLGSSSIDWQMCVTVTRALTVNGNQSWGASILWSDYSPSSGTNAWVLKPTSNLTNIFTNTINNIGAGWANTDDERGIKAAWWHIYNGDPSASSNSGCHRSDAALSVILISDEDERSVGGDKSAEYYSNEYKPLENDDLPSSLTTQVKSVFGVNKKFTFNSIIVKPNDSACMKLQDSQGSKSHNGQRYSEISNLTGGGVGSICEADFSTNLNLFKGVIQDSMASIPLQCPPVGPVTVTVNPTFSFNYTVQGSSLVFTPSLPAGRQLILNYKCSK